ncbi:unnamed protein product, partial [Larinioides sclopetarius]
MVNYRKLPTLVVSGSRKEECAKIHSVVLNCGRLSRTTLELPCSPNFYIATPRGRLVTTHDLSGRTVTQPLCPMNALCKFVPM